MKGRLVDINHIQLCKINGLHGIDIDIWRFEDSPGQSYSTTLISYEVLQGRYEIIKRMLAFYNVIYFRV